MKQMLTGLEGYNLFLLTNFGDPEPWTVEEVQVHLNKVRAEITSKSLHTYYEYKRVWAQKPLEGTASTAQA